MTTTVIGEVYAGTGVDGLVDGDRLTVARFSILEGLSWAADDSVLYVSDYGNRVLRIVDPSTDLVTTIPTGTIDRIEAIEANADGTLWCGNVGQASIDQIDPATGARTVRASGYNAANTPRIGPDGMLYFSHGTGPGAPGKTVARMPYPTGTVETVKTGIFAQIEEMFFSPTTGLLYVADFAAGDVIELDVDTGAYATVLTGLGETNGVVVDAAGVVYASSRTSGQITIYNPTTGARSTYFSDLSIPNSIDIGPDGALYVADWGYRQVIRIAGVTLRRPVMGGLGFR